MMEKLRKIICCFITIIIALISCVIAVDFKMFASAEGNKEKEAIEQKIQSELLSFVEYGKTTKERRGRVPGSKAEYKSAMYIHSELSKLLKFKPVNNASTKNGIETFEFIGLFDGLTGVSQNIIFKRESKVQTDKKVILATHYDTAALYKTEGNESILIETDGINDCAASVATLLTLARELDELPDDFGYDIELIFFGANSNNYAGVSYYLRGQTDKNNMDTLLMVNFDKIAYGDYNYAYVNEFKTTQEEYLFSIIKGFKEVKNQNMLNFNSQSPNGLDYTHIALESSHALFMEQNVNVVSFFSGNYENALTYGIKEFEGKEVISYTDKDSMETFAIYSDKVLDNLASVCLAVNQILSAKNFIVEMERPNTAISDYEFWTNDKLAVFITAIFLVVFIAIYFAIYWWMQEKAKKKAKETNINQIVLKIATNLGEGEENSELKDAIDNKIKQDTNKEEDEEE